MSSKQNNTKADLWHENAADRSKSARATVLAAYNQCATLAAQNPRISKEIHAFAGDLDFIQAAYAKDPNLFRASRAFTAVHLPAIVTSLQTIGQMNQSGNGETFQKKLEQDIASCFASARQVRAMITENAKTALEVETVVLKSVIPSDNEPQEEAPSGVFGKLDKFAKSGRKALMEQIDNGRTLASDITSNAVDRVGAGTDLASTLLKGVVEESLQKVTSPLSQRVRAITNVLTSTSAYAIVGGLAAAIIFPPAVPFAVGIAVLEGTSNYSKYLEDSTKSSQIEQDERKADRDMIIAQKLKKFTGKSSIIRMDTPHIHMAINAETGDAQGIILSGKYAGQDLNDIHEDDISKMIETSPDQETKEIIVAWVKKNTRIEKPSSVRKKSKNITADMGLDLLTLPFITL